MDRRLEQSTIISPRRASNAYLYWLGFFLMLLNKVRHSLSGYRTPRIFSADRVEESATYSIKVCVEWEQRLKTYTGLDQPFEDKDILEVGPGPDLGNGLVLLAKGARTYTAVDKHNLLGQTHRRFYEYLLNKLEEEPNYGRAAQAYDLFVSGKESSLKFLHDPQFDLRNVEDGKFDLMVSRAAIEHFDAVSSFFKGVKNKIRPGGAMVSLIDAKTHTRYIRDIDPLNILRYSEKVYSIFRFSGSPNRWLMSDYVRLLENLGYSRILTGDYEVAGDQYIQAIKPALAPQYREYPDIGSLAFWLMASF